jgi:hypothetical protein
VDRAAGVGRFDPSENAWSNAVATGARQTNLEAFAADRPDKARASD